MFTHEKMKPESWRGNHVSAFYGRAVSIVCCCITSKTRNRSGSRSCDWNEIDAPIQGENCPPLLTEKSTNLFQIQHFDAIQSGLWSKEWQAPVQCIENLPQNSRTNSHGVQYSQYSLFKILWQNKTRNYSHHKIGPELRTSNFVRLFSSTFSKFIFYSIVRIGLL